MLYYSIYMTFPELANLQTVVAWCWGVGGKEGMAASGYRASFHGDEKVLKLIMNMGEQL